MRKIITLFLFLNVFYGLAQDNKSSERDKIKTHSELKTEDIFYFPTNDKNKKDYVFQMDFRSEIGYVQNYQHSLHKTYPNIHLYGGSVGLKIDFRLPARFSIQTGLIYSMTYGHTDQHFHSIHSQSMQVDYLTYRITEHQLTLPAQIYYTQPLVKKLNLLFYGGPRLQMGLSQINNPEVHVSVRDEDWENYSMMTFSKTQLLSDNLNRFAIQFGIGGGLEWDRFRLVGGYEFGLNNLVKNKRVNQHHMWEWAVNVSFGVLISRWAKHKDSTAKE